MELFLKKMDDMLFSFNGKYDGTFNYDQIKLNTLKIQKTH